ncbi:MAG: hypothetical protein E7299_01615 [Lachnospiraceae bacterium]|nr:hypothetical protein [Lachnospiraceae bacterium]
MGMLEIILLVSGAIVFILSFVIPVKKEQLNEETKTLAQEEIRELVSREVEQVKSKMDEMSEEACQERIEKAQRSMERISNEKIMAVNEYSDTVLSEIQKNHQEVVFLYDMLNDKQSSLKDTIHEADKNIKDLLQQVKDSEITVRENLENVETATATVVAAVSELPAVTVMEETPVVVSSVIMDEKNTEEVLEEKPSFVPFKPEKVTVTPKKVRKSAPKKVKIAEDAEQKPAEEKSTLDMLLESKDASDVQLQFSTQRDNGINSNERILELHKAGKSNMAIAKELGLGIGEVKLVIDLYKGLR